MARIDFDNTDYINSYGHNPKGFGMWAFRFRHQNGSATDKFWTANYGDAKKSAMKFARENGFWKVEVLA